ncbi:MAG: hypothetical protein GWN00_24720 [Aliifodinibius sp.]|nr:hypothetical protein [Fodinibius sp.]NIV14534.1 hypothetical protein [Fodinibius sp.]NIY27891.1 hypothetical protein [Fodinibius sp.]
MKPERKSIMRDSNPVEIAFDGFRIVGRLKAFMFSPDDKTFHIDGENYEFLGEEKCSQTKR